MKKSSLYSVHTRPQRILDDFRGDRVTGQDYAVIKYGRLGEEGFYTVTDSTIGCWCDCPASYHVRKPCRHMNMVRLFKEENRVDTGYQYDYDHKQWREPNEHE